MNPGITEYERATIDARRFELYGRIVYGQTSGTAGREELLAWAEEKLELSRQLAGLITKDRPQGPEGAP
jgi:hypothetical protein